MFTLFFCSYIKSTYYCFYFVPEITALISILAGSGRGHGRRNDGLCLHDTMEKAAKMEPHSFLGLAVLVPLHRLTVSFSLQTLYSRRILGLHGTDRYTSAGCILAEGDRTVGSGVPLRELHCVYYMNSILLFSL